MISQEELNLFVYFAALAIIFFTSRFISSNAVKRGMSRLWGLLALLGVLPGLVIYLIIRKPLNENSNLTSKNETYDGLKKLGELKAAGILTDEEFNEKKKDLLKKIN